MTFAHVTVRGDAARYSKSLTFLELFADLRNRTGYVKPAAEWIDTLRAKRVELLAPERD